jgi:hypothetical protein
MDFAKAQNYKTIPNLPPNKYSFLTVPYSKRSVSKKECVVKNHVKNEDPYALKGEDNDQNCNFFYSAYPLVGIEQAFGFPKKCYQNRKDILRIRRVKFVRIDILAMFIV